MYPTLTLFSMEINMYDAVGNIGIIAALLYNLLCLKQKKNFLGAVSTVIIHNRKYTNATFFAIIETIILTAGQLLPITFMNRWFGGLVTNGNANYFGAAYTFPFFFILVCLFVGVEPLKQFDMYVPSYPLILITAKLSCFFDGCCAGIESSYGLYNHYYDKVMFPVQLVESGLAFLIFLFMLWYKKRAKKGTMFPIYLILYSSTRFFSEFLRMEPNVFGILKTYQILCLIGIALGILELVLVLKFGNNISAFFNRLYDMFKKKFQKQKKQVVHHKKR